MKVAIILKEKFSGKCCSHTTKGRSWSIYVGGFTFTNQIATIIAVSEPIRYHFSKSIEIITVRAIH